MKSKLNYLVLIIVICLLCSCVKNADTYNPSPNVPTSTVGNNFDASNSSANTSSNATKLEEIKTFGDLSALFPTAATYKSWTANYYADNQKVVYKCELFNNKEYTYYSLIDSYYNQDFVIRYTSVDPENTTEVLHNGLWTPCIEGPSPFSLEDHNLSALNFLSKATPATDATVEIEEKNYKSKRIDINKECYLDYICDDGVETIVFTQCQQNETSILVFKDIVITDTPNKNSRFSSCFDASKDDTLIAYQMRSGSMLPAINIAEIVYFKPADASTLKVGDIVLVRFGQNLYFPHRIVRIEENGFILKGDNNQSEDMRVFSPQNIVGVLVK